MAAYLVLSPEGRSAFDPENRIIKDGFSWAAALFPVIYAIAHGLYLDAAGLFVLRFASLLGLSNPATEGFALAILVVSSLIYGFEARNRWALRLAERGFVWQAAIAARNISEAEEIYYAAYQAPAEPASAPIRFDADVAGAPDVSHATRLSLGMITIERGRR